MVGPGLAEMVGGRMIGAITGDIRLGAKKARVAVARKLACLLLRLWKDNTPYEGDLRTT